MSLQDVQPFISFLGTIIQLGGALLLTVLFLLLGPYSRRRKYFHTWCKAWIALTVAIVMVVVRHNILPSLTVAMPDDTGLDVRVLYAIYQLSKLCFYGLLAVGTAAYVGRTVHPYALRAGGTVAILLTVFSTLWAKDLNQFVVLQAPVAVFVTTWCAAMFYSLPKSRRTLGGYAVGGVFWAMAALWGVYFAAFGMAGPLMPDYPGPDVFDFMVRYNSYFDVLTHVALGYAMVVLLMEDTKREADDAHAELAVTHDELRRAALYDSVTGSMNRRAFQEGLGLEAARATFGTVMMLDMDNLKGVNDRHGHTAGDGLLRYMVEVVRGELRSSDKLYRWGGDEFLMVFPGADPGQVKRRIDNVVASAPALRVGPEGRDVILGISLGAARYGSAEELRSAIERADADMYREKYRRKANRPAELASAS